MRVLIGRAKLGHTIAEVREVLAGVTGCGLVKIDWAVCEGVRVLRVRSKVPKVPS